ncbi:MAG: hypothetical protein H6922_02610 [Pseudomonadaceae bacterium]|nr:hypothetical protein [Pseudomonadaceae bacterium]
MRRPHHEVASGLARLAVVGGLGIASGVSVVYAITYGMSGQILISAALALLGVALAVSTLFGLRTKL